MEKEFGRKKSLHIYRERKYLVILDCKPDKEHSILQTLKPFLIFFVPRERLETDIS